MPAKIILTMMLIILPILYVVTTKLRKNNKKYLQFERFFFQKLQEKDGSLDNIRTEVIEYGKELGIKEDEISSLIHKNSR